MVSSAVRQKVAWSDSAAMIQAAGSAKKASSAAMMQADGSAKKA